MRAPPATVARLAANTGVIAARLLRLRELFPAVGGGGSVAAQRAPTQCSPACSDPRLSLMPQANASAMVASRLSLLLDDDLEQVAAAADRLRALLPTLLLDRFVEAFPLVLDVDDFERALAVRRPGVMRRPHARLPAADAARTTAVCCSRRLMPPLCLRAGR